MCRPVLFEWAAKFDFGILCLEKRDFPFILFCVLTLWYVLMLPWNCGYRHLNWLVALSLHLHYFLAWSSVSEADQFRSLFSPVRSRSYMVEGRSSASMVRIFPIIPGDYVCSISKSVLFQWEYAISKLSSSGLCSFVSLQITQSGMVPWQLWAMVSGCISTSHLSEWSDGGECSLPVRWIRERLILIWGC